MWVKPQVPGVANGGRRSSWQNVDPIRNGIASSPILNDFFVIQKYTGMLPRHRYRIMLVNSYRIAISNTLEELVSECWILLQDLITRVPTELDNHGKIKWIIGELVQIERKSRNVKKSSPKMTETHLSSGSEEDSDIDEGDSPSSTSSPNSGIKALQPEFKTPETKEPSNFGNSSGNDSHGEEERKEEISQSTTNSSKISLETSSESQQKQEQRENFEDMPLAFFSHQLRDSFSDDATREQRTTKYIFISILFATIYSFLLRYSSFDLFLLFLIFLLMGVVYVIKDRKTLIMKAAKRKVQRVVRTEKKKWFG